MHLVLCTGTHLKSSNCLVCFPFILLSASYSRRGIWATSVESHFCVNFEPGNEEFYTSCLIGQNSTNILKLTNEIVCSAFFLNTLLPTYC